MAHWKKRFPSKFLQAADLDKPIDAVIKTIGDELIGVGEDAKTKPVLYFTDRNIKPSVLNQTRAESVAAIAGTPDDDRWVGVRVRLQKGWTRYKGERVECVDIVAPPAAAKRPKTAAVPQPEPDDSMPNTAAEEDEEEPF